MTPVDINPSKPLSIAVVGTGISGMSAAWLLSRKHHVTVYEKDDRMGGHTNTVEVNGRQGEIQVDTGFIVYNERNYPNLVALFKYLGVQTRATDMSFGASMDGGTFEYSGSGLPGLLAQPRNLLRPRMWSMIRDLLRFFREAPQAINKPEYADMSLGQYLESLGYKQAFIRDYLLPMGSAIWSTPALEMLKYPLTSFVRFFDNHGLLTTGERPVWRTVEGGSREYMRLLTASFEDHVHLNTGVTSIHRQHDGVQVEDRQGQLKKYDHVVIAAHADQALSMLTDADSIEKKLLSKFRYERNLAILHNDEQLMPKHRRAWSSWNFMSDGRGDEQQVSVSYWMNRLQHIDKSTPLFVSLNPLKQPRKGRVLRSFLYDHPTFNTEAIRAQRLLWNLQGVRRTWYCGAYFGHGFHEDGLQAGLAVAEQLGGMQRPWKLDQPSSRIHCAPVHRPELAA